MNKERLMQALNEALPALPGPDASDGARKAVRLLLHYALHYASKEPARSDPRLVALIAALWEDPALALFNGYMRVLPHRAWRVEYDLLAGWLLERAQTVGANHAISDLQRYITTDDIPSVYTHAVAGMQISAPCSLAPDLELVPWQALPDSPQKRTIFEKLELGFGPHWPTAALLRKLTVPRLHVSEAEDAHFAPLPRTEVEDALLSAGLIGPTAPYILASWLTLPEWAPSVIADAFDTPFLEGGIARKRDWPSDGCEQACSVYDAFARLDEGRKVRLRLAMERLNRAMRRLSPVDAAIDLGIALEVLFLADTDNNRELAYRMKLRAARYLGSDYECRHRISTLIGDLYTIRSAAVHTGKVPNKKKTHNVPTHEVLDEGFALAARTIVRFIFEGDPDWERVTLS